MRERDRQRQRERERQKEISLVSRMCPQTHNLGMCPDQELNLRMG